MVMFKIFQIENIKNVEQKASSKKRWYTSKKYCSSIYSHGKKGEGKS